MTSSSRWVAREPLLAAAAAATLASLLAWLGPPGTDLAAHAYQRTIFLEHGFTLWNNFWYAGRYSFISYSILYYPLAALLGIRLLAVATIATAALAFTVVLGREFGPAARWSSRTFAVVWAGIVLSAAFPFALGVALALLALWGLQAGRVWRFALVAALTLAASPLAFLLLTLVLGGTALGRRPNRQVLTRVGLAVTVIGTGGVVLQRAFPGGGSYPFPFLELLGALGFCAVGLALTWGVERARVLCAIFVVYAAACVAAFLVPSELGGNIARLRFAALPIGMLVLALRQWKPRIVGVVVLGLALSWNLSPLLASYASGRSDAAAEPSYWVPAIDYLKQHLTASYRVEAVATAGHWEAVYLPRAGIPIARGWFRQDDFPQNRVLYGHPAPKTYVGWLRRLGARYVVLTNAAPDYSARAEAALLRGGRSGLQAVLRTQQLTIYAVPSPRSLVTGPAPAQVLRLSQEGIRLAVARPGTYRLAIRYSAYWQAHGACVGRGKDGMMIVTTRRAGVVDVDFDIDARRLIASLEGGRYRRCSQ
ncbi:MAG: hypothetical protein V7645_1991 [Actinomycetota bacterium]